MRNPFPSVYVGLVAVTVTLTLVCLCLYVVSSADESQYQPLPNHDQMKRGCKTLPAAHNGKGGLLP